MQTLQMKSLNCLENLSEREKIFLRLFHLHVFETLFFSPRYASAGKLGSNLRVTEVLDVMKAIKGENLYVQAKLVIATIDNFMASADEFITTAHTPKYQNDEKAGTKKEVPHNMQMVCWNVAILVLVNLGSIKCP